MRVYFIGPPCSGKSSIARALSVRTNWHYISTGDIARQMAEEDPETRDALAAGKMAPPYRMDKRIVEILYGGALPGDVVVDGYPRYIGQLEDIVAHERASFDSWFVEVDILYALALKRSILRARKDDGKFRGRWDLYQTGTRPVIDAIREDTLLSQRLLRIDGEFPTVFNARTLALKLFHVQPTLDVPPE